MHGLGGGLTEGLRRRRRYRFRNRELTAGTLDDALRLSDVHKLESEAKSVPLPDRRQKLHLAQGQGKLQSNNLSHGNLHAEHGRNSRFADIHCVAPHDCGIAWIYANFDLQLEPVVAAYVDNLRIHCGNRSAFYSQ